MDMPENETPETKQTAAEVGAPKKRKSVGKNYIFNVIYQIFVLIVPLITTPYVSRILGADGVGQYSFTFSLMNYFTLAAALGFGYYAQREIAKYQDDKKEQSKIFWEIIIVRFFSVGVATLVSCILGWSGVYKSYTTLMWIWLIQIVAVEFDITFLFQGNEEFGKIVGRNILVKAVSVAMIFLLVKKSSDVWLYALCTAGSTILGNISLWFYLPKFLAKVKWSELHPLRHVVPTLRLFIPTIATSIYTVLDKTLIGVLIPDTYVIQETRIIDGVEQTVDVTKRYADLENGYYEQAEKIVKMAMTVITSLGTVLIPRNSKEYADGNLDKLHNNVYFATNFVWFLGAPLTLGIAAVAPNVLPWFLGDGFNKSVLLMQLLSPLVIIIGMSNVFGLQYLIPTNRDTKFTIGVTVGAVTNLVLNLAMIPFLWSVGAVIATLIAETTVTITMGIMIHKEISMPKILLQSIKPLISGGIMFAAVYVTQKYLSPTIGYTLLLILEGIVVYFLVLFLLRDKFFLNLIHMGLGKAKKIFHKKQESELK
jgi:O-antigen/teichoic acid export membrane protein